MSTTVELPGYREEVRCGSLPSGVSVTVTETTWQYDNKRFVSVAYRGTIDALQVAGCLTPGMISNRPPRQRQGRTQRDEHGMRFTLKRAPTKALPERVRLDRWGEPAFAMQLPGVRELFPEGIPEPAQAEAAPARQRPFLRIVVNNEFAGLCTP
jgi:hypothetical protein